MGQGQDPPSHTHGRKRGFSFRKGLLGSPHPHSLFPACLLTSLVSLSCPMRRSRVWGAGVAWSREEALRAWGSSVCPPFPGEPGKGLQHPPPACPGPVLLSCLPGVFCVSDLGTDVSRSGARSGHPGKGVPCSTIGLLWLSTAQMPPERAVFLSQNFPALPPSELLVGTPDTGLWERPGLGESGKVKEEGRQESQWLLLNSQLQQSCQISPPPFCSPAWAGGPQLLYLMPMDLGR